MKSGVTGLVLAGAVLLCAISASAQKLEVKVVDRQDKEEEYDYAAVYRIGTTIIATGKTFKVHGATFTLQLPDGRLAVVNCESKFAEHFAGRVGNHRSCRTPLVDSFLAEFNGDNAKLIWVVSLDGKKTQSETYKVLAILNPELTNSQPGAPPGHLIPAEESQPTTPQPETQPSNDAATPSVRMAAQEELSKPDASAGAQPTNSVPGNTGAVMFTSEPKGADIYVDGKFVGNSPSLVQLSPGSHSIRIEASGYKPWTRALDVTTGGKITVQAVLGEQ